MTWTSVCGPFIGYKKGDKVDVNHSRMSRRNWCFTLFNYEEHLDRLRNLTAIVDGNVAIIRYICWQEELSPTTSAPHLQGYLELRGTHRIAATKKLLGLREVHLEPRRGSQLEAIEYCRKVGGIKPFEEFGVRAEQGDRTDLAAVHGAILRGASEREIFDLHFSTWAKYPRSILRGINMLAPKRRIPPIVTVIWGDPGLGKTRWVYDQHADILPITVTPAGMLWLHGWDSNKVLILDDFEGVVTQGLRTVGLDYLYFLKLIDRWPFFAETKFGYASINAVSHIYITSMVDPRFWYPSQNWEALKRRFTTIIHLTIKYNGRDEVTGNTSGHFLGPTPAAGPAMLDCIPETRGLGDECSSSEGTLRDGYHEYYPDYDWPKDN